MRPYYVYRFEGSVLVSLYVHGCAIIFFLCRYSTIQQRVCFCLLGNLIAYELKEMERDGWELWQWCEKEVDMIHDLQRKLMVRTVLHRPASHSFYSGFLERTADTKQNRSGNVLPTPARPWVEGPALPITHDASTDALWRAEEVSLFMVVLAAFSFSSQMGGYREQKYSHLLSFLHFIANWTSWFSYIFMPVQGDWDFLQFYF